MSNLTVADVLIGQDKDGRFCLNDLHRASGGHPKDAPAQFFRNDHAIQLIQLLISDNENCISDKINNLAPVNTVNSFKEKQGTYVVKELVYAYAMWISTEFQLKVIRAYDAMATQGVFKLPKTLSEALLLAGTLAAENERLEAEKQRNLPKIEFAEKVRALEGSISIGDFAKLIGTGQNRLFKKLRDDGFLMVNNHPMQSAIDRGLLTQVEQTPYTDSKGRSHPAFQTRITGKGQVYFEKRYRIAVESTDLVA